MHLKRKYSYTAAYANIKSVSSYFKPNFPICEYDNMMIFTTHNCTISHISFSYPVLKLHIVISEIHIYDKNLIHLPRQDFS